MTTYRIGEARPVACTLDVSAVPGRLAQWDALLAQARSRQPIAGGGVRVEFTEGVDLQEVARLAGAEQHCCAFLSFAITIDDRGVGLEVRAPYYTQDILASLFGSPL